MKKILDKAILICILLIFVSVFIAAVHVGLGVAMFCTSFILILVLAAINNTNKQREKDKEMNIPEEKIRKRTIKQLLGFVPFFIVIGGISVVFLTVNHNPEFAAAAFGCTFVMLFAWMFVINTILNKTVLSEGKDLIGTIVAVEFGSFAPCTLIAHKDKLEYDQGTTHIVLPYTDISTITLDKSTGNAPHSLTVIGNHNGGQLQLRLAVHKNDLTACKALIKRHKKAFQL